MKQREDTIQKWFSLWLDSREAELSDLFTEDAAYIESWGPEYYGREMIARWFRDWHRSGQVLRWDIQEFLNSENTTVVRWYFQCQISGEAPTGFDGLSLIRPSRIRLHRKAVLSLWISNGCRILCVFTLILFSD